MSNEDLNDDDVAKLIRFARVLIPVTAKMPAVTAISGYAGLLRTAAKACHYTSAEVRSVLDAIPADPSLANAEAWFSVDPVRFDMAAVIVSGAYYMSRDVLDRLDYPAERQHPAGVEDFADEYATGVLDAVIARGPCFVDPRKLPGA